MKNGLLLLSGGIDSPVAGFIVKDKFNLSAIHFSQTPFTDDTPEKKSILAAKKLGIKELIIVEAGEQLQKIADTTFREYYFVLMKIFFMKASELIAEEKNIDFLITGESLGQVSSQTASNLNNINRSVKIEIIRPLLFMDKQEIIDISKKEGFYTNSCGKEMCDALASGKPRTKTNREKIDIEIKKCNLDNLVKEAIKNIRIIKIN